MIEKKDLQERYVGFNVHSARLKDSRFFLMCSSGLSLHIDIKYTGGISIQVFKYSSLKYTKDSRLNRFFVDVDNIIKEDHDRNHGF